MAITTTGDLIGLALRSVGVTGVGQSPTAADANDCLAYLTMTVAQWQRKRWLVWDLADTAIVSTGASSYTVGPTGTFPMARPDKVEAAFARLIPSASISGTFVNDGGVLTISGSSLPTSPGLPGTYWNNGGVVCVVSGTSAASTTGYLDFPLSIIESREDYYQIGLKSLSSVPLAVFYESAWPTGVLRYWPIPAAATYELHIATKAVLPVYVGLTDALGVPPEYIEALLYSLAVRISMNYAQQPNPGHVAAMKAAMNTIRIANTQISTLSMPPGVVGRRGSGVSADTSPSFQSGRW
jgi:hypothetical protein